MSEVLAVLEQHHEVEVLVGATALAILLGIRPTPFMVPPGDDQSRADAVINEIDSDVAAAVLSARPAAPVCWHVMPRVATPLVVIPRACVEVPTHIKTVLLPLDATPETAAGVAGMAHRVLQGGARLVPMHFLDADTAPGGGGRAASHAPWPDELLLENLPPGTELDLRRASTPEEVVATARRDGADLLMMGWRQDLDPRRARTVRHALTDGSVPVLLVPTGPGPSGRPRGPSALDPADDDGAR